MYVAVLVGWSNYTCGEKDDYTLWFFILANTTQYPQHDEKWRVLLGESQPSQQRNQIKYSDQVNMVFLPDLHNVKICHASSSSFIIHQFLGDFVCFSSWCLYHSYEIRPTYQKLPVDFGHFYNNQAISIKYQAFYVYMPISIV